MGHDANECATTTCPEILKGLLKDKPQIQRPGACNLDCVKSCWKGHPARLQELTRSCGANEALFYHACGNTRGLHIERADNKRCNHWRLNLGPIDAQVQIQVAPKPVKPWVTIFHCEGNGKTSNRLISRDIWAHAESLRVCVDVNKDGKHDANECATTTCPEILKGLLKDKPQIQRPGACNLDCVKSCWKGHPARLQELTRSCGANEALFYHACGNTRGLHIERADNKRCNHWSLNLGPIDAQVQIQVAPKFLAMATNYNRTFAQQRFRKSTDLSPLGSILLS